MKNIKYLLFSLICMFCCGIVFAANEVVIKSITPIFDEESSIVVNEDNSVIFNDKNQSIEYKIVLENTLDYDVLIDDINLTTPTEKFLKYEFNGLDEYDVLNSKETKEVVVSLETVKVDDWGRNFNDELIANVTFERYVEPKVPVSNIKDLFSKFDRIDIKDITSEDLKIGSNVKIEDDEKITVWVYPDKKFLGYFNVVEEDNFKQIDGLIDALKDEKLDNGEHYVVLVSDSNKNLGYINVRVNESNEILEGTSQEEIDNPFTSTNSLVVVLILTACGTITIFVLYRKNKITKYAVFIGLFSIALYSTNFNLTNAKEKFVLPIKVNASYESQNVMKPSGCYFDSYWSETYNCNDFWNYNYKIKNFYIENEIREINEYVYKFDVSDSRNNKVIAYMIKNEEDHDLFDLYLIADGIIYMNEDASFYFACFNNVDQIYNFKGLDSSKVKNMNSMFLNFGLYSTELMLDLSSLDTSNAIDMSSMFDFFGSNSTNFILDLSNFNTSKVTNMSNMFSYAGSEASNFKINLSSFDTSKVTNMSYMFNSAGSQASSFELDLSSFDTSKVTNMSYMFKSAGSHTSNFKLDLSSFNTSNVTTMEGMFQYAGYNSPKVSLDLSKFDTSNVTDMSYMFEGFGYSSINFTLDLSNFDTSQVTNMESMFCRAGYDSTNFKLDLSSFDTSNVINMSDMFNDYAYNSTKFELDLSNFDTSNVTSMLRMFSGIGYNSIDFILDLSNFDTSNVSDFGCMFSEAGYNSTNFSLDISSFDTSNAQDMWRMFADTGYNVKNFNLDLSHFDMSKVMSFSNMFENAGYNSTKFVTSITISNPKTSRYTNMFKNVATKEGSKLTVNYTSETSSLVDNMIATKSSNSNVVKGVQVD